MYVRLCFAAVKGKSLKLDDVLNILAVGFLRGGTGGFLKGSAAGEMIKGSGNVNRDIRVGVTHVSRRDFLSSYFADLAYGVNAMMPQTIKCGKFIEWMY